MKIIEWIRNIMLVFASMVIVATLICLLLGYRPAVVMSGSMEPVFQTGSLVMVEKRNNEDIAVGDVIAFHSGIAFITHRVVGINEDGFVTKGDANEAVDPWIVNPASVDGRVNISIPYVGYVIRLLSGKSGLIIFAIIISCIFLSKKIETSIDTFPDNQSANNKMTSA